MHIKSGKVSDESQHIFLEIIRTSFKPYKRHPSNLIKTYIICNDLKESTTNSYYLTITLDLQSFHIAV